MVRRLIALALVLLALAPLTATATVKTGVHVTVAAATTDTVTVPAAFRSSGGTITLNSGAAFRLRAEYPNGAWDDVNWPVDAAVPWELPANLTRIAFPALSDSVWVHFWPKVPR